MIPNAIKLILLLIYFEAYILSIDNTGKPYF